MTSPLRSRIGYLEQALACCGAHPGVPFWQGGQILDWYVAGTAPPETSRAAAHARSASCGTGRDPATP